MRPRRLTLSLAVVLPALTGVGCSGCDDDSTIAVSEEARVLVGSPAVETATPVVNAAPDAGLAEFRLNVPRQCDFFEQSSVRKVDILWVVDSSSSMKTSQENLAREFPGFINALLELDPPVDFHIGVTSMDTDSPLLPNGERGSMGDLHGFDLGAACPAGANATGRFIACDESGECNVQKADGSGSGCDATGAFAQMARVGTGGSPVERGLHAAYLALTKADNLKAEVPSSSDLARRSPFVRPDAALFVVFVSDEDDSSCTPFVPLDARGRPLGGEACTADPGCRCDAARASWGGAGYFTRFLETYKGYGHADLVTAAAVVCDEQQRVGAQNGDPSFVHLGCPDQGSGTAYYGARYIEVAEGTGGTASSLRGSFSSALRSLGFSVSGLRRDFRLSRGPYAGSVEAYVTAFDAVRCASRTDCVPGQECRRGACATPVPPTARSLRGCSAEHCPCDLHFELDGQPPVQSSIEVCYDVDSTLTQACQ